MVFSYLTYLQPTHYFQLPNKFGQSVFPKIEVLSKEVLDQLKPDKRYVSPHARDYDRSWQAIQRGYIGDAECYTTFEEVPRSDNYLFLRKNFNPVWVFYVLVLRLLSLHHPIKECKGWFQTRHVSRDKSLKQPLKYDFKNGESYNLIESQPKVSVIIPTLNRYDELKNVLKDFEKQTYKNFELIIVDQSDDFSEHFYKEFNLEIHLIRQKEKALWLARNTAITQATGAFVALSEDDVRIEPDWLDAHLKCLDTFHVDVSAGVFFPEGGQLPQERSYFALASQFATGNAMLRRSVFNDVGLFDRQFEKQRMGDGEFGMRLYMNGIKSVSNPKAFCLDVKAPKGGLRDMGSWDAFRPSSLLAPRPIPSVLYYFRRYFGNRRARLALLRIVPISIVPYRFKKNKPLLVLGILGALILSPLVLIQVIRSWYLASKKLDQGPLITHEL